MAIQFSSNKLQFDVRFEPANPLVGECVRVHIDGVGTHTDVAPEDANKALWIQTQTGEDDLEFKYRPGNFAYNVPEVANIAPTRDFTAAYATPGQKVLTIESNTWNSDIVEQQFTIPVTDPDTVAWTHDYYVDLSGDTSGMPAVGGVVQHITNSDQLRALHNSHSLSDLVRINWRGGVVHNYIIDPANAQILCNASHTYMTTFGSADPAEIFVGTTEDTTLDAVTQMALFNNADSTKITMLNLEFDCGYSPVNGAFERAKVTILWGVGTYNASQSVWRVKAKGHDIMCRFSAPNFSGNNVAAVDCLSEDAFNFGISFASGINDALFRGCRATMQLNTARGDTKTGGRADMADHAVIRIQDHSYISMLQCDFTCLAGWSGWGGFDKAIQPVLRAYTNQLLEGMTSRISVAWNKGRARVLAGFGASTPEAAPYQVIAPNTLVVGNSHDHAGQGTYMLDTNMGGGITAYANVNYIPYIASGQVSYGHALLAMGGRFDNTGTDTQGVSDASWQAPVYVAHNVMVSDMGEQEFSGGPQSVLSPFNVNNNDDGSANLTAEHNIFVGDLYSNSADLTPMAHVDRGADFRPISSQFTEAALETSPPIDFMRNRAPGRGSLPGAFFTASGNAPDPAAPSWSTPPVIGELTGSADILHEGILGVLEIAGLSAQEFAALECRWRIDGVEDISTANREGLAPTIDWAAYPSGTTFQCNVTASDRSGVRASSLSNIVTKP